MAITIPEKLEEKKLGNWSNVAELIEFKIVKFPPQGLLGKGKADVMLLYKQKPGQSEKEQKRMIIFGSEDAVYDRVLMKILEKKNLAKADKLAYEFKKAWQKTEYEKVNVNPSWLLNEKIKSYGLNPKEFAARSGLSKGTVYHHTSGSREISKAVAVEYAEKLNCDPVDLMFEKKTITVWSKVNFLNPVELETLYNPGQLYAYAATSELEKVIVPRDIYREDIKAIKIDARGSMYHNKVCFYYRATDKEPNVNNQLCIVGAEIDTLNTAFDEVREEHYFFGLYEESRGQSNLINPDPYVTDMEKKYILKNFEPTFIAPVISILNPDAITDDRVFRKAIPSSKLVRQEEQLQAEIENLKVELAQQKIKNETDKLNAKYEKELLIKRKEAEKEIKELMEKVEETTEKINQEIKQKKSGIASLFSSEKNAPIFHLKRAGKK